MHQTERDDRYEEQYADHAHNAVYYVSDHRGFSKRTTTVKRGVNPPVREMSGTTGSLVLILQAKVSECQALFPGMDTSHLGTFYCNFKDNVSSHTCFIYSMLR